jgi:hypothetical protein
MNAAKNSFEILNRGQTFKELFSSLRVVVDRLVDRHARGRFSGFGHLVS